MNVQMQLYRLADRISPNASRGGPCDPRASKLFDAANAIDGAFTKGTEAIVRAYARGRRILERANG